MIELTPRPLEIIEMIFPVEDQDEAIQLLTEQCAQNLPLSGSPTPESLERIRIAAIKASGGDLQGAVDGGLVIHGGSTPGRLTGGRLVPLAWCHRLVPSRGPGRGPARGPGRECMRRARRAAPAST